MRPHALITYTQKLYVSLVPGHTIQWYYNHHKQMWLSDIGQLETSLKNDESVQLACQRIAQVTSWLHYISYIHLVL